MGILGSFLTPQSPSQFQKFLDNYLDFHRVYLFRVMFFDGLIGAAQAAFITNFISGTDTPTSSTGSINLGWMGSKLKVAGKTEFPDWKVTVRDDALSAAHSYFQTWRDNVYSVEKGTSKKIDNSGLFELVGAQPGYKKSAIVMMLGNDKDGLMLSAALAAPASIRAYILNGIWPKELGSITLDYSTENIATFPVTFSMDSFAPYSLTGAASSILNTAIGNLKL